MTAAATATARTGMDRIACPEITELEGSTFMPLEPGECVAARRPVFCKNTSMRHNHHCGAL
jgi:hypothetical protein